MLSGGARSLLRQSVFVFAVVAAIVGLYLLLPRQVRGFSAVPALIAVVGLLSHQVYLSWRSRAVRRRREALAVAWGLRSDGGPSGFRHAMDRLLRRSLHPLVGEREGLAVRVEWERLSFGEAWGMWPLVPGMSHHTVLAVAPMSVPEDLDLRVERRRSGERSDARVVTLSGARTPFEREHHVFTNEERVPRTVLAGDLQRELLAVEELDSLRVEGGEVRLRLDGAHADPVVLGHCLRVVKEVARRLAQVESGGADVGAADPSPGPWHEGRSRRRGLPA